MPMPVNAARAFVVIPTFNEKGNVGPLVERIFRLDLPVELVFVDDASPDGTGAALDGLAGADGRLHVIHRAGPRRLGSAYIAGFKYALGHAPDFILTMDADLSHDPAVIPALLAAAGNCDLAIGSRYTRGGRTTDFRFHRLLLSRCANWLVRTLLGLRPRDCTSGFRCYRAGLLKNIPPDGIRSNGYSFLIELLYKARGLGAVITEVPINFTDRAEGVSKISRAEIFRSLRTVFSLGLRRLAGGGRPFPFRGIALALCLSAARLSAGEGRGCTASALPDHVALSWTGDPSTTMTVTWRGSDAVKNGWLQYSAGGLGPRPSSVKAVPFALKTDLCPVRIFTARLRGLSPGTKYSYRAGAPGRWSPVRTFTTSVKTPKKVKFLVFGDSQGSAGGQDPYGVWRTTVRGAYAANPDASFFVNVGDLVDEQGRAAHWDAWFGAAAGVVDTIPAMPAHGNHETHSPGGNTKPLYWLANFSLPMNGPAGLKEEVYSFDYGPVHIAVLDSQGYEEKKYGDILASQREWLRADLASSGAAWKLVFFHKPVYEQITGRANADVKEAFAGVLESARADVVFNAHDHAAARTFPVRGGVYMRRPSQGTVYYMTGRSGERPHAGLSRQAWDAFFYDPRSSPCYLVVRADAAKLNVDVVDRDGPVIDSFYIDKARDASTDSTLPLPAGD